MKNGLLELERFNRLREIFMIKKSKIEQDKRNVREHQNQLQFFSQQMNKKRKHKFRKKFR